MKRQSGFTIMKRLILELKPLAPVMAITISFGVLGFLAAIAIATFASVAIGTLIGEVTAITFKGAVVVMIVAAILRGFLRYVEQLSGHYIAFKILYILRDKVFLKLRSLAPAKLDGKDKGNLISIITSDIELLEVFYAHTIAPIAIAIITNSIIVVILYSIMPVFALMALGFYLIVGFVIPYLSSSMGKESGVRYRALFGETNSYILDSLRGLKEVLFFNNGQKRMDEINNKSKRINEALDKIKLHEGVIRALSDLTIMIAILSFVFVGYIQVSKGNLSISMYIIAITIIASSFGPVVALSNLSNTLLQTFASAERLFSILDESANVNEVIEGDSINSEDINYKNVTFGYKNRKEPILKDISLNINPGDKVAIIGESGAGKSTLIKLLMRFWDVDKGTIRIDSSNIKNIKTEELRNSQSLVSQETYLFNSSILDNIKIGKLDATREEVKEAAKKASIDSFIGDLPKGYDTSVGELGDFLSSGEKQRIGLARAFLSERNIMILDEPTSNLDTLNEAAVLKAIEENSNDKTIVMISHRRSTTAICNREFNIKDGIVLENKI